jgi:hypothetical protein
LVETLGSAGTGGAVIAGGEVTGSWVSGAREGPERDGGADGDGGAVIKGMVDGCWAEADASRKLKIKLSKIRLKTNARIDYL